MKVQPGLKHLLRLAKLPYDDCHAYYPGPGDPGWKISWRTSTGILHITIHPNSRWSYVGCLYETSQKEEPIFTINDHFFLTEEGQIPDEDATVLRLFFWILRENGKELRG